MPPKTEDKFLLLNGSYEPLRFCDWRKAVLLIIKQKAMLIAENVLKLVYYVKLPHTFSANLKANRPSRKKILERDNYECQYCGRKSNLTLDHIIPRSNGGNNSWENLVTACEPCNLRKGNKSLLELRGRMELKHDHYGQYNEFDRLRSEKNSFLYFGEAW